MMVCFKCLPPTLEPGCRNPHGRLSCQETPKRSWTQDNLANIATFANSQRFFQGNFVERVDAHLDAIGLDARAVRSNPDANVIVDNAFKTNKYSFHWLELHQAGNHW
jgi:hypothetical protein